MIGLGGFAFVVLGVMTIGLVVAGEASAAILCAYATAFLAAGIAVKDLGMWVIERLLPKKKSR